jgi:predicted Zn-dependent protease
MIFTTGITFGFPARSCEAFTVSEEREVGEKLLSIVRTEFKLVDDPDITQYITKLGKEVLKEAGPQYFDYHFFMVQDKEVNAFAAPSGLIFLNTGLIELVNSENELVSVLAHEAGHIVSRHYANRLKKSAQANIATVAMILAGVAAGGGAVSDALITGAMATNTSMNLKFSRDDERESDQLSYKWMREQERDPAAIVSVMQQLRKVSLYRSANLPPYLLTHPEPQARMSYVQDLLLYGSKTEYRKIDEFEFKRMKYRILSMTKDPQILAAHFRESIQKKPEDTPTTAIEKYGLSQALFAVAEYEGAAQTLQEVIKQFPDKVILKTDLGVIYFDSGKYDDALKIFNEAWGLDRNNHYTMYHLARTLEQTGNVDSAIQLYDELLVVQPDYSDLYYRLGKAHTLRNETGIGFYYLGVFHWYEGDARNARLNLSKAMAELAAESPYHAKAKEMLAKIDRLENLR